MCWYCGHHSTTCVHCRRVLIHTVCLCHQTTGLCISCGNSSLTGPPVNDDISRVSGTSQQHMDVAGSVKRHWVWFLFGAIQPSLPLNAGSPTTVTCTQSIHVLHIFSAVTLGLLALVFSLGCFGGLVHVPFCKWTPIYQNECSGAEDSKRVWVSLHTYP